ncbi:MAG TPA: hypothetical protein VMV46_21570 [Thermoanaerobaculia bacterium]|nr:hypothetical protein [Thermoanaerobaculia bacterium]
MSDREPRTITFPLVGSITISVFDPTLAPSEAEEALADHAMTAPRAAAAKTALEAPK